MRVTLGIAVTAMRGPAQGFFLRFLNIAAASLGTLTEEVRGS
jgi:hypothetical protein